MRKEHYPSGSSWKDILLEIYGFAPNSYGESKKMFFDDDKHDLAIKLRISGYKLRRGISFLENHTLAKLNVSPQEEYSAQLEITKKGFEVALELEKHNDAQKIQLGLVLFTGVLILTDLFGILLDKYGLLANGLMIIYVLGVSALVFWGIYWLRK
jgi:hypothetical protein